MKVRLIHGFVLAAALLALMAGLTGCHGVHW